MDGIVSLYSPCREEGRLRLVLVGWLEEVNQFYLED